MPHLIAALKAEVAEEEDIAAWLESDDEAEPEGYDTNDLPLFESILPHWWKPICGEWRRFT
jgi:hypothetical protein